MMQHELLKIVVFAINKNIPNYIQNRFFKCVNASYKFLSIPINVLGMHLNNNEPEDVFCKSRHLNWAIKQLILKGEYNFIIQTDIDVIPPPGIIEKSVEIVLSDKSKNTCYHVDHIRTDELMLPLLPEEYNSINWKHKEKLGKWEVSHGCWNAMLSDTWMKTDGWDERMIGWGKEDSAFRRSAIRKGIRFFDDREMSVIHVNHSQRTIDNRPRNAYIEENLPRQNWLI